MSFVGIAVVVYGDNSDSYSLGHLPDLVALIVSMLFFLLTLFINSKSKHGSVLVVILACLPLYLGFYLGGL